MRLTLPAPADIEAMSGLPAGGDQARRLLVMWTFTRCDDYPKTKQGPDPTGGSAGLHDRRSERDESRA